MDSMTRAAPDEGRGFPVTHWDHEAAGRSRAILGAGTRFQML